MTAKPGIDRFSHLDFAGFAALARDESLSKYEKIGFPDSYREGREELIFGDICRKLPRLAGPPAVVLDIGPGCSDLPGMLVGLCDEKGHQLTQIDSEEMLALTPKPTFVRKISGPFPHCRLKVRDLVGRCDVILCYSVLHYAFVDSNPFDFLDLAIEMLGHGGEMLIGDIPNLSKRRRFFSSEAGKSYHRAFTNTETDPVIDINGVAGRQIDDSVILGLLLRARAAGCDAYIVPQAPGLPMANRREDILVHKP